MKNILVTGVSRGLGSAICQFLLERGYRVWGISRSKSSKLETQLDEYPSLMKWKSVDISKLESLKGNIFDGFVDFEIKLHGVVNNAAIAYDDLVTNIDIGTLNKMLDINVLAPMVITKYAIRNMLLHNLHGSIVHISSISAHTGYKGLAMYASTKGALEAFSKGTSREWGEKNIRSNCIVVGFMDTDMNASLTKQERERIYNRTALKKATDRYSVAASVEFLLSDEAKSITGENIRVDSGTI